VEQHKTLVELIQEMRNISGEITERAEEFADLELDTNVLDNLHYLSMWCESLSHTLTEIMLQQSLEKAAEQDGDFEKSLLEELRDIGFDPTILSFGPRFNGDSDDEGRTSPRKTPLSQKWRGGVFR